MEPSSRLDASGPRMWQARREGVAASSHLCWLSQGSRKAAIVFRVRVLGGFAMDAPPGSPSPTLPKRRAEALLAVLAVSGDLGCSTGAPRRAALARKRRGARPPRAAGLSPRHPGGLRAWRGHRRCPPAARGRRGRVRCSAVLRGQGLGCSRGNDATLRRPAAGRLPHRRRAGVRALARWGARPPGPRVRRSAAGSREGGRAQREAPGCGGVVGPRGRARSAQLAPGSLPRSRACRDGRPCGRHSGGRRARAPSPRQSSSSSPTAS